MRKTYGQYVGMAWDSIKGNFPLFAAIGLLMILSISALNLFPIIGSTMASLLLFGYFVALMKLAKSEELSFQDILWPFINVKRFLQGIFLIVVHSLGILVGTLLLLVPGVWLAVRWSLAFAIFPLMKQEDLNGWRALQASSAIVKGNWWWFAGLLVILGLINLIGFLFFGIGLLISFPMSALILIYVAQDVYLRSLPHQTSPTDHLGTPSFIKVSP